MRAVIQRVTEASVTVGDEIVGTIDRGLVVLLGVRQSDGQEDVRYLAEKTAYLRVFDDGEGRMNLSLIETGGGALVVSQFTLLGDARKGRRPSYAEAAEPAHAEALYLDYCRRLRELDIPVETGRFRAQMRVQLVGDGPVTILLDSERNF